MDFFMGHNNGQAFSKTFYWSRYRFFSLSSKRGKASSDRKMFNRFSKNRKSLGKVYDLIIFETENKETRRAK